MDEELIHLRADWSRDREGARLKACLLAHFALERAQARTALVVRLWLALSSVVWIAALTPRFPPPDWRGPVLVAWAALATGALGMSLSERYWKRQLEHRVAKLPGEEASRSR